MSLSFNNRYFTLALPLLIVVTLAVLAGCGSTSTTSGDTGAPTATSTPSGATATVAPTNTTGSAENQINVSNFSFSPSTLTVKVGTTVTFKGITGAHTVTSDTGSSMVFDQGVSEGSSITITFANPGTYKYHCSIHPQMHGTIVVTA